MMLSLPDDEQMALSQGVADFLAGNFPVERLRSTDTRDVERWDELVGLGVIGLSLDEDQGGLGLSVVEEVLVCRELGRTLVSPAIIGAMLAPHVAIRGGQDVLAVSLRSGERRVGLAVGGSDGDARVVDAADGLFLFLTGSELSLVEGAQTSLRCIDETVCLAAAPLPGTVLAGIDAPELAWAAHVMAAAMLCGQLEAIRDMAADYARTRVQFGRPIGAFQAIKHRCTDVAMGADMCWAQVWNAANALHSGAADAEFQAHAAKWLAGDEAIKAARFNIQVHGGMGFTQEVDAQLLLKRAHVLHQLFGNPRLVPARLVEFELET
ncbi:MAG: acyl-CoA/acyl-ACP dehydrogenase [Novosphingobium sp.]|nr:acyl-CoA/acyl-ACP dehydrogenase [Novosphingobium sp.]